ncbi:DUF2987 domain-containing protein [uncultured Paraglaciecola sp.]|uniref:DUF2987 domain-containing protein n=1 Tax=uncultured Paraglaciecola sp. TaxID=1765024 RepID=UPI00259965B8|nr:DUF2987 domain-containing protein [uncultured Paraglaciecola sp.]
MKVNILIMLMVFSSFSYGEPLEVEYASFYSHVKKLQSDDTQALRFAFGFQHIADNRLCKISSAQIVTQKQTLPLVVEANYRFTVPTDKILKMAKAIVVLDINDQANQCDISVQLETKPQYLKMHYPQDELDYLLEQYTAFFDDMGGFLSFMMPAVEGLVFHFDVNSKPFNSELGLQQGNRLILHSDDIKNAKNFNLPIKPIRITALVEK